MGALLLIAAMTVIGLVLILGSVPLLAAAFVLAGLGIGLLDVLINVEGSAIEQAAGAHPHADDARRLVRRGRCRVGVGAACAA